jgi:alpha-D-xyloside xylohydrolase
MPYLFAAACEAHAAGVPVMRAMFLEFPADPACDTLDRQYMLGESLLVAPIFTPDGTVDYYVPAGRWTHFLTGQVIEGGRWLREKHDFLSLPLLVRPNSIIAVGSQAERPDYDYGDGVTLQVYELADGAAVSATIPSLTGEVAATFSVSREGRTITVEQQGTAGQWQLLLVGIEAVASVEGGTAESSAQGVLVRLAGRADRLKITL